MAKKLKYAMPLFNEEVAPRFDLASEVLLFNHEDQTISEQKILMLSRPSAEDLCQLILSNNINVVICGAVEDEFYQYLTWKKIKVLDYVAGKRKDILEAVSNATIFPGSNFFYH